MILNTFDESFIIDIVSKNFNSNGLTIVKNFGSPSYEDNSYKEGTIWIDYNYMYVYILIGYDEEGYSIWYCFNTKNIIQKPKVVFDVFGDGSNEALFTFDFTLNDLGGVYNCIGVYPANEIPKFSEEVINLNTSNSSLMFNNSYYLQIDGLSNFLNDYVDSGYSFSFWYKWNGTPSDSKLFGISGSQDMAFQVKTDGTIILYYRYNVVVYTSPSGIFPLDDGWHNVVVNISTSFTNIYIDNQLVVDAGSIIRNVDGVFSIGGVTDYSSLTSYSNIYIDNFRVFNRTLTSDEINIIYSNYY